MSENLKQLISQCTYVEASRVQNDIDEVILNYETLRFKRTSEPGNPDNTIIVLYGTMPVYIQGSTYHFPIEITVPSLYPIVKPDVVLRPTDSMVIDPSHPNVDNRGNVFTPYLDSWVPEDHTILFALLDMVNVFSAKSPLHSKSANPPPQPQPQQPQQSQPTISPTYIGFQQPQQQQQQHQFAYSNPYTASTLYPSPYGQQPQQQQQQQQPPPKPPKPREDTTEAKRQVAEELTIRAQSIFYETTRLEEELRSVEEEGARGVVDKARVEKEATEMQASIDAAKAEGGKTSAWIEANRASAEVLTQEKVDALTNSEDALERQHTAVMAADTALSDLIYALDKALKDGKVDLDTYLKLVRKYAAEQYNVRALAAKVEQALRQ